MKKEIKYLYEKTFGHITKSYGQDQIIKKYIRWPNILPLNLQIQHGWYSSEIPDLGREDEIEVMLVWSKRIESLWRKYSKKDVYIIGAPFIIYKELHQITLKQDAKGTVVFPNHSTPSLIEYYDIRKYCQMLKELPPKYHPITICLHYRDYNHGKIFKEYGFNVVSAGDSRQRNMGFVRKYYDILSSHKFASSNEIGSYTFYAIDLGLPFFIYGPESYTIDKQNTDKIIDKPRLRKETRKLFPGPTDMITEEQKIFVSNEIGEKDRIEPDLLRKILFEKFLFYEIPQYPKRLFNAIKELK